MRTGLFSQEAGFKRGFRVIRLKCFPENDLTNSCADDRRDCGFLIKAWEVTNLAWLPPNEQVDHQVGVTAI